jgi:hypothetical protein
MKKNARGQQKCQPRATDLTMPLVPAETRMTGIMIAVESFMETKSMMEVGALKMNAKEHRRLVRTDFVITVAVLEVNDTRAVISNHHTLANYLCADRPSECDRASKTQK